MFQNILLMVARGYSFRLRMLLSLLKSMMSQIDLSLFGTLKQEEAHAHSSISLVESSHRAPIWHC
jgi:hypothetical protein